jgi:Type II secretory pathway, component PulF
VGPAQAPDPDEDRRGRAQGDDGALLRTLATLVAAGVDIIKALEIAGSTAGNWLVETASPTCA